MERADDADASRVGRPSRDTTIEDVTHRQGSTLMGLGILASPSAPRLRSPAKNWGSTKHRSLPLRAASHGVRRTKARRPETRRGRASTATSAFAAGRLAPCSRDEGFGNQRSALPTLSSSRLAPISPLACWAVSAREAPRRGNGELQTTGSCELIKTTGDDPVAVHAHPARLAERRQYGRYSRRTPEVFPVTAAPPARHCSAPSTRAVVLECP